MEIGDELDLDSELEFEITKKGQADSYTFLSYETVIRLRDHLTKIIASKKTMNKRDA